MTEPTARYKTWKLRALRYLKPAGIVLAILLVLQVVTYFSSDFFLRNYLKKKVAQASEEKYEIDFDRFYISLFARGVIFEGLSLNPVEEAFEELSDIPYYKITVPKVSLTRLFYLFGKREFQIGLVKLSDPSIEFKLQEDLEELLEEGETSPLMMLEEEIKKTFGDLGLREIRIKELLVDEADLLLKNFISQKSIKVDHADIRVKDIQLLQERSPQTPFNAAGFAIDLDNFEILLADSVHTIQASEVHISSLEQFIEAKKISISPDLSKKSLSYFQVELANLRLTDADVNKVFYTSEVEVGSLKLVKPEFNLYSTPREVKSDVGIFDLYELIAGILTSIQIADLVIEKGKFTQRNIDDPENHRIKADRIDFEMKDVYVGPNESLKKNQFFYAQDAAVKLHQVEIALGDEIHRVTGDFVSLSSFDDAIQVKDVRILPTAEAEEDEDLTIFEIHVPALDIQDSNLKKIYNQGIVDIAEVMINSPEIILRDVKTGNGNQKSFDLQALTQDFLQAIYVGRLEIKEGSLVVDNNLRVRQDSLSFGTVNLVLEHFALDDQAGKNSKSIFLAEALQIELKDYALKLSDNLHVFKASNVFLDTKASIVRIEGFSIQPFDRDQIQNVLDRYDKNTVIDIYVPRFLATGVDLNKAYFGGVLNIKQIRVPSPKINVYSYRQRERSEDEKVEKQDVLELLQNYFTAVTVDSLILQRGSLNYENYVRENIRTFSEDNVSIAVKNFRIDQNTRPEDFRLLFSEEVDLGLNNYVFSIADGKYNIVADRISFNTAREEIITSNVQLRPSNNVIDKTRISANIPSLSFTGVDLERFLFDNELSLSKVKFSGSSVNLLINKDFDDADEVESSRRRDRALPKTINLINIDTVTAENANFNLSFRENGIRSELVDTGINLSIYDFMLDSATLSKGDISGFFGGLSLAIDEFWLTLPDSVHRVTFTKVELDTRYEGIFLNNLRIIPYTLSGKPGIPVISGHIPTALIKTEAVSDVQFNKDLLISELRLFRPDIEIFLDDVAKPEKEQEALEEGQEAKTVLETIKVEEFEIVDGNLAFFDKNSSKEPQHFKKLNITLKDLDIDLEDMSGFDQAVLLKKEFKVSLPDYKFYTKDSMNVLTIGYALVSQDQIQLQNVSMKPRYGRFAYTRKMNQEIDVMEFSIPEVLIHFPNLERLAEKQELQASLIEVIDLEASIFRDKRYPLAEDQYKMMPQELMQQVGFVAEVDTLQLINGMVRYTEFPEKGLVPGEIYFSELYAALYPFHLGANPEDFSLDKSFILAMGKLNGAADISLQGQMRYQSPYPMQINAQLGAFDFDLINSILVPNAHAQVREGRVHGGDWSFTADNKDARGSMVLMYNDLRVDLLDERTLELGKGRKRILTFVLNTFALKSHNPRKFPRNTVKGSIYEPRDTEKFIFNYWWKTTFSGLKGTFGFGQSRPPKKLPVLKRKEEE
ncbi:hypothetical protein SAMN06295967_107180 [Belliella buryatensis]|uniref:Uncharacterized protein n=1 Tax=Belliella buryatensis TaxID=1500549 RepID=A0A239DQE3_9BACT|nr:hypothetical protein [Belliella buryatensis]SNS34557.1 hypothetical protein SAMN06295967_107180 [Belliella buryatensis]